ncbi:MULTISPECIES: DsrE family protein [unclassified Thioalkalivibrio]|uniref:DsrE family protein n=1 Tax=unclassified Thioalkalivibrio TaxID=2621013 RepID=UPI00036428B9|nr:MULTISPECIES: DsrE family protein [unclassified Thioalkalivibrio]
MPRFISTLFVLCSLTLPTAVGSLAAADEPEEAVPSSKVEALLEKTELPDGVAFEIVENDRAALSALLPEIQANIRVLRQRDPDLPIAVVTHGAEQFTLTRAEAVAHGSLHAEIESLVMDDGVNVVVCGTFAGWRDLEPDAFPEHVEVATAAPDRLNDLEAAGYTVIRLRPSLLDAPAEDPWEFDFGQP